MIFLMFFFSRFSYIGFSGFLGGQGGFEVCLFLEILVFSMIFLRLGGIVVFHWF